ncbi:C40 family peptidase [Pontibacter russatus]|uniref:C40 family peptidase n=1 Tax=Pontibacter russatus TaxID=2694929 RepID=UPI00137B22D0|nr:SH3 domain-containing C40 family peptidase [Pontibacter russatus]
MIRLPTLVQKFPFLLLALLMSCTAGRTTLPTSPDDMMLQPHLDAVRQQYAPDKRTALFQVEAHGHVLAGETNLPEAKEALLDRLQAANIPFQDSIQVLPAPDLASRNRALVTISVANLRTQPRHAAELATQATLGTPLKVWKKDGSWYLVQTPDAYLAWVDAGGISLFDEAGFNDWQEQPKVLYTEPYGFAYAAADAGGATVSDLVYGDVLVLKGQQQDFFEVVFPDGRSGYIPTGSSVIYEDWLAKRQPTAENLVQASRRLLGVPYLWGGTSFKGVDCSGFTKTIYFMNGLVLPRDASQQIHIGELVDTSTGWEQLRPGDLLFFGVPATEGKPERVVHVGMWIGGDMEFIHASGRVRISSMNPAAANYDASERERFLRAKRIRPQDALLDLRTAALYE